MPRSKRKPSRKVLAATLRRTAYRVEVLVGKLNAVDARQYASSVADAANALVDAAAFLDTMNQQQG